MSEIVKSKINKICPSKNLKNSMMREVESWVRSAFRQLGYIPKTYRESVDKAWHNASPSDSIADFVFKVWRYDNL